MDKMEEVNPDLVAIGKRIKEVRQALGLTQEQFAEPLGIHPSYISIIETSRNDSFGVKILCRIVYEYKISVDFLFYGIGPMFIEESRLKQRKDFPEEINNEEDLRFYMDRSSFFRKNVLVLAEQFLFNHEKTIKKKIKKDKH